MHNTPIMCVSDPQTLAWRGQLALWPSIVCMRSDSPIP